MRLLHLRHRGPGRGPARGEPAPRRGARGRQALDRNLCRCGAQRRIVGAVVAAGRAERAGRDRRRTGPSDAVAAAGAGLAANPRLSRWIRVADDGTVDVRVGKVELGQGILTALAQIAADELDVAADRVRMLPRAHRRRARTRA